MLSASARVYCQSSGGCLRPESDLSMRKGLLRYSPSRDSIETSLWNSLLREAVTKLSDASVDRGRRPEQRTVERWHHVMLMT